VNLLAIVVFWVLVGLAVGQGLMVCRFVWALLGWKRSRNPDQSCPKAAVILCVRGPDPFLSACIKALLNQDYPRYDVRIVVDRREDPAWGVVEEVIRRWKEGWQQSLPRVQVRPLVERRDTCSLKCSSVLEAVSTLDESHEVVALLDADIIPHRTWLRELVAPLSDERAGAATGNRWYMPAEASWGALVRYLWNAAAVVQMYWYGIPWGGSLAIKDTMLPRVLRKHGLHVAFVPSLMMVNREACEMPNFFNWVRRQLLAARLYHTGWWAVVAHGIGTSLVQLVALGVLLFAVLGKHWEAAAWVGGGLACYWVAMPLLLAAMEACVRRLVRAGGEPTDWLTGRTLIKMLPAIPLTQVVYPAALVSAMFLRTVRWRGVLYRVHGPWQIGLIEYRPYEGGGSSTDGTTSL